MPRGTVRNIHTGEVMGRSENLTQTFVEAVMLSASREKQMFVVFGRNTHRDMRQMVDYLRDEGITCVYDSQTPPDTAYIFAGTPDELGFSPRTHT